MKPVRRSRSGGDSCSCTTCVYKSESDQPSLKRIIDKGSKIDRLYYGKYIPLRERKLLERLVRTRAVYDDIRAQLVSDSTVSLSTKRDSNSKRIRSIRAFDDSEKSSAGLLEIVNIVDRGAVGSAKLDDCCSCCSCSSGIKLHGHKTPTKRYNKRRPYAGANEHEARERVRVFKKQRDAYNKRRGVRFKTKFIKSDPCTCTYKLIKKHSKAFYNKMYHYHRPPLPRVELQTTTDEEINQKTPKIREIARTSKEIISEGIHKIKESKTRMREKLELQTKASLEKFNQAKEIIKSNMRDGAQKLKGMSYKQKSESHTAPEDEVAIKLKKDSISKFNEEQRRRQIMKEWECEPECIEDVCLPEECLIKLKQKRWNANSALHLITKKVHNKPISYNKRIQDRKTGDPLRQINFKIQAQKLAKSKYITTEMPLFPTQKIQEMKKSSMRFDKYPKNKNMQKTEVLDISGQSKLHKIIPANVINQQKISADKIKTSHLNKTDQVATIRGEKIGITKIVPTSTTPEKRIKFGNRSLERKSSERQVVRIGSSFSFDIEFYKTKPGSTTSIVESRPSTYNKQYLNNNYKYQIPSKVKKPKKRSLHHRGSQIAIKKSLRHTQTGGRALKRCFCMLKLEPKANIPKIRRTDTKNMTVEESRLNSVTVSSSHVLQHECEPGVCLPGECNPYECVKLIDEREAKRKDSSTQARKTKSTSSYTSRSDNLAKVKYIQSSNVTDTAKFVAKQHKDNTRENAISYSYSPTERAENVTTPQKQAVRIGSTFSFDVEFYKSKPNNEWRLTKPSDSKNFSPPKQQKYKNTKVKVRGYQEKVQNTNKNSQTQQFKKGRIGTSLRRCFCTLKLQKKEVVKVHSKETFTTGTETIEFVPISSLNKDITVQSSLFPYQCEPGVCIPDNCNPYKCLKLINTRDKSKNASSQARKKKSSSSYTSRFHNRAKAKYVQSMIISRDGASKPLVVKRRHKRRENTISDSQRRSMRVGSTFSFNIEFYKGSPYTQKEIMRSTELKNVYVKSNQKEFQTANVKDSGLQKNVKRIPKQKGSQTAKLINSEINQRNIKKKRMNTPTLIIKNERDDHIGTSFKRCFCTLNLKRKKIMKNHVKRTLTSGTETSQLVSIDTANKSTKIESKYSRPLKPYECEPFTCTVESCDPYVCLERIKKRERRLNNVGLTLNRQEVLLESYECEPFTCIPGECDPHVCLERINRRNTRLKDSGSTTSRAKITSCSSGNKSSISLKSAKVQYKPMYRKRWKNFKPQKLSNYPFTSKSRQAVKISSKCSFDIELFKYPITTSKQIDPAESIIKAGNTIEKRLQKNKEIKMNRLNVAQTKTQVRGATKRNTGSVVGPLLKRCFCTMNLQRKWKLQESMKKRAPLLFKPSIISPMVYMVNTAMVKDMQNIKQEMLKMSQQFKDTYELHPHRCINGVQEFTARTVDRRDLNYNYSPSSHQTNSISLSRSFRRSFYVWNLKLENKGNNRSYEITREKSNKKKIRANKKLDPYECEPGVCIPGECNPYECQKLISKRLIESSSTKSGSEHSLHSISTSARHYVTKSKGHKQQTLNQKTINPQVDTLKKNRKLPKNHHIYREMSRRKQAVHIGSSFSFDIEFFKNLSIPQQNVRYSKYSSDTNLQKHVQFSSNSTGKIINNYSKPKENRANHSSVSEGTGKKDKLIDSQSQSSIKTIDRETFTRLAATKRCFCTLKLQKRGRLHKKLKNEPLLILPNDFSKEKTVTRGQNTTKIEPVKLIPLKPYECEPNVCIPGQCDPYTCLDIMKKRNYRKEGVGTNTKYQNSKSISSMTTDNRSNKSHKSRAANVNRATAKKLSKKAKDAHIYPDFYYRKPFREAVRVGSNFSFDIEFFKDHPLLSHASKQEQESKEIKHMREKLKEKKYSIKPVLSSKEEMDKYVQFNEKLKHNTSQIDHVFRNASTATSSLIKRCFCTTQLYKSKIKNEHIKSTNKMRSVNQTNKNNVNFHTHDTDINNLENINNLLLKPESTKKSSSFLKRCMCILSKNKHLSTFTTNKNVSAKEINNDKINNQEKQDAKPKIHKAQHIAKLDPYECKAGICVPGECDPHVCDKIMRNYRKNNFETTANTLKTRSVSISSPNTGKKHVKTLKNDEENNSIDKSELRKKISKPIRTVYRSSKVSSPNRNVVRIGSNFSFDIEFYKDQPFSMNDNENLKKNVIRGKKKVKRYKEHPSIRDSQKPKNDTESKERVKINSTVTYSPSAVSKSSQVKKSKVKHHGTGINNFIKRCFCTLKLHENTNNAKKEDICECSIKTVNKGVITERQNNLVSNILLPYECEPNVCIPYQCNPHKCEKLIKLRHKKQGNRELGISTGTPKKISVKSLATTNKPKNKKQAIMSKDKQPRVKQNSHKYAGIKKVSHSKQSVRIGSTFHFNVEFFKDNNHNDFYLHKHSPKNIDEKNYHQIKRKTKIKRTNTINQTKIGGIEIGTSQTQFDNQTMRTQSTMTSVLKNRCFCTLSLKKSTAKPPETLHASVNTETKDIKRSTHPMLNLLPYECEPNKCIPGECNPILCLERINQRHKTSATATEDHQKINVATKMIKVKDNNKKAQIERLSQSYSNKKHVPKTGNKKVRQAVRIGSNFSFDMEFFKENYPEFINTIQKQQNTDKKPIINKNQKDKHRLKNQVVHSDLNKKELSTRGLQSMSTKKVAHGTGPFLKRCFCTLTLQKNKVNKHPKTVSEPKVKQRKISTETKSTMTNKIRLKSLNLSPYECVPFYCALGECDPNECETEIKTNDLITKKYIFKTNHLSPFECEPGTCVPGKCDPYECENIIKIRDTENKTQNTRAHSWSQKGVGIKQENIKSRKTQACLKINDTKIYEPNIYKPEIVEVPRFNNIFKNKTVRIGSNISFNIEIYKENLPQRSSVEPSYLKRSKMKKQKINKYNLLSYDKKNKIKGSINLHDRDLNTGKTDLRSCESECDIIKTGNKSTESENILKRCFCTLTLQNKPTSRNHNRRKLEKIPYPQKFEIRRVAVEDNPNMLSKGTHMEVKSVSTKRDKKYFKNSHSIISTGLNHETIELKTILPYKPDKFNNSVSKTILPLNMTCGKSREVAKNCGKKLSRKTSKRSLNTCHSLMQENHAPNSLFHGIKNFITYCAHIFYLNSNSQNYSANVKKYNRVMLSDKFIPNSKPKKCQSTCPYYTKNAKSSLIQDESNPRCNKKKFMKHATLQMELNQKQEVKNFNENIHSPCNCSKKFLSKQYSVKSKSLGTESWSKQQAMTKLKSKKNQTKIKKHIIKPRLLNLKSNPTQEIVRAIKTEDILSPCLKVKKGGYVKKERSTPLKVRFLNSTVSNYCHPCKGKYFNKEEFHKAAGDQLFNRKGLTRAERTGIDLASQATQPLFDMRLDSGTYDILNRDQVFRNVKKLNTKYHKKPPIEIELDARKLEIVNKDLVIEKVINERRKKNKINEKKKGLKDFIIDSIMELAGKSDDKVCPCHRCVCATRNVIGDKVHKRKGKTCICGSSVCSERADRMKKPVTKRQKWKPCSCGSPVCGSESAKIKALTAKVENKCLCRKEMKKRKEKLKALKVKKEAKERAKRLKDYKKQDKIRRTKRLKKQRQLERKIDKKAPDTILHTENVLDVGKIGVTLASDAVRQAYRIARDPKHAYESLKTLKENPELILPCLEAAYKDSGISGTLRRIRLRCFATRGMTKLRRALETNPVSRYLLYMGSTDPKKRLLKKKKKVQKRERERSDFACSLYMASLRKRPHLSVYDRCPWFYPHFLRIVQVWKQFTDVCLYLVAAVVWSPCILCMELCRACMCCFLCTG